MRSIFGAAMWMLDQRVMAWSEHIVSDPKVLAGKPVIKGTRLSVDFLLGLFAEAWTREQVLESYPQLTSESLQAVFAFAAEVLSEERLYSLPSGS